MRVNRLRVNRLRVHRLAFLLIWLCGSLLPAQTATIEVHQPESGLVFLTATSADADGLVWHSSAPRAYWKKYGGEVVFGSAPAGSYTFSVTPCKILDGTIVEGTDAVVVVTVEGTPPGPNPTPVPTTFEGKVRASLSAAKPSHLLIVEAIWGSVATHAAQAPASATEYAVQMYAAQLYERFDWQDQTNPALAKIINARFFAESANTEFTAERRAAYVRDARIVAAVAGELADNRPPPSPDPSPEPTPEPTPDTVVPMPGGITVLVIEEVDDRKKAENQKYLDVLLSTRIRKYLTTHCAKTNGQPRWRWIDDDSDLGNAAQEWRDLMKQPRQTLPWIIISNGMQTHSQALPDDEAAVLELLKKWGGE